MPSYIDQTGRAVEIPFPPKRIISLVPSQTEFLAALGLEQEVVGITKFCTLPDSWFKTKQRIGGTKNLRLDLIRSLKPDLIIANKEENKLEQIELLEDRFPVWASDVVDLPSALDMMERIGQITGRAEMAVSLTAKISASFADLPKLDSDKSVLYLIWQQPWMAAGKETFIDDVLKRLGLVNLASALAQRYPVIPNAKLLDLQPDYILLSSEPFPFGEKHLAELQLKLPNSKILLVDGRQFSWYGSRLLTSAPYFRQMKW
jgi:ABC-type Fe3+-hydroxamate transport system substrate-binding protein